MYRSIVHHINTYYDTIIADITGRHWATGITFIHRTKRTTRRRIFMLLTTVNPLTLFRVFSTKANETLRIEINK